MHGNEIPLPRFLPRLAPLTLQLGSFEKRIILPMVIPFLWKNAYILYLHFLDCLFIAILKQALNFQTGCSTFKSGAKREIKFKPGGAPN